MLPITFTCTEPLPLAPEILAGQILDLSNWIDFTGSGFLPGIRAAEFDVCTPAVVDTRIEVTNKAMEPTLCTFLE